MERQHCWADLFYLYFYLWWEGDINFFGIILCCIWMNWVNLYNILSHIKQSNQSLSFKEPSCTWSRHLFLSKWLGCLTTGIAFMKLHACWRCRFLILTYSNSRFGFSVQIGNWKSIGVFRMWTAECRYELQSCMFSDWVTIDLKC